MGKLFKTIGIGVGLRAPHMRMFIENPPSSINWVEVISENYMAYSDGTTRLRALTQLLDVRKKLPVVLHGVGMSIGSINGVSFDYLQRLKDLIEIVQPEWVSDHLCFSSVHGIQLHDLLPLPFTEETIQVVADNIMRAQDFLRRRILIENASSYISYKESEMAEWDFLSEIVRRSDCGILLDLNNVFVSSFNHKFNCLDYLKALPVDRIGQIHLAGPKQKENLMIDTHGTPVRSEVWDLYKWVISNFGQINSMIERDENIPPWETLEKEVLIMKNIYMGKTMKVGDKHVIGRFAE